MKILCFIDSFVSGGAQRQMVELAVGLKSHGHDVEMFVYHPELDFFRAPIDQAGIPVHSVPAAGGFSFSVLFGLVSLLRRGHHEAMISFLAAPNVYAELASIAAPSVRLIVSERNSHQADGSPLPALLKRLLHVFADSVVSNNYSHADWLRRYPWLRHKVETIYNGYVVDEQPPSLLPSAGDNVRLLAIGRVVRQKNALNLIRALCVLNERRGESPRVSWVGRYEEDDAGHRYRMQVEALLAEHPEVRARWEWLGERRDVAALLESHDALILPSLYEGLPNAVCESFIAGRPVLASAVCDNPRLIEDGLRGVLFDPDDPNAIADAIERFIDFGAVSRNLIGVSARKYAQRNLSIGGMVVGYERLLISI